MGTRGIPIALVLVLLCAACWSRAATHYDFIDLHNPTYSDDEPRAIAGGKQVGNSLLADTSVARPVLWSGTADSAIDMTPPGYDSAMLFGTSATHQVGMVTGSGAFHAALWNGTPDSVIDLHGVKPGSSEALDVSGTQQVGTWYSDLPFPSDRHAVLWHGTAESLVDLHPSNHIGSSAVATSGARQGGWTITPFSNGRRRAVVWSGTAASAQELNSDGFVESEVVDVAGVDAVGNALVPVGGGFSGQRAVLWRGSGERVVLYDDAYSDTEAFGMNERYQVGRAWIGTIEFDPVRWAGSGADFVNLRDFMPSKYANAYAVAIDENDNILGRADVFNTTTGLWEGHAVMWVVPEPSAAAVVGVAAAAHTLAFRRRRR